MLVELRTVVSLLSWVVLTVLVRTFRTSSPLTFAVVVTLGPCRSKFLRVLLITRLVRCTGLKMGELRIRPTRVPI